MRNRKTTTTSGKTPKRGFAVLDREKALKSAAGAIKVLRGLSGFATSAAAWRCSLGYAIELLEEQLNEILLFSSSSRLPDELFGDGVRVADDLGQSRKDAAVAIKTLRKLLKDARADLSVDESQCNRLDDALGQVERELNNLLPPTGAPPKARLSAEWFGDDSDACIHERESDTENRQ